jgi:hypothetical protein
LRLLRIDTPPVTGLIHPDIVTMFDLSQFTAAILNASAAAHCDTCGEVLDGHDRCGCDY